MRAKKALLVANTDWYLYNFRLSLAMLLRQWGWEVLMISPAGPYVARLVEAGFSHWAIPLWRRGLFLPQEAWTLLRLIQLYAAIRPDLVHHFTLKPVLYGSLAARLVGKPVVVNSITGKGTLYLSNSPLVWSARLIAEPFLRLGLRSPAGRVIFENDSDRTFFLQHRLISSEAGVVIEGVGVDLDRFRPRPEPPPPALILMPARLLRDKGVAEFVAAARLLRSRRSDVRFALVGAPDPGNPSSLTDRQIVAWMQEGIIEWWGHRSDMPEVYAQSHIVTLPSHSEGSPTVLLEAAACGRAVVATDIPGNRAVLEPGETGMLVPVGDAAALAEAWTALIDDEPLRTKMGQNGRRMAETRFDQARINERTAAVYADAFAPLSQA